MVALQRGEDLRLRDGPDPRRLAQSSCQRGGAKLRRGRDGERLRDRDDALRRQPEQAAEADELGLDGVLELLELFDRAGLDELAQARLDPRPDAAELADTAGADELRHRRRGGAKQLGG